MSDKDDSIKADRRSFLKLAAATAPAAVAATALSGTAAKAVELEEAGSGLRDTAHTRAYFDSAKF
ncbi:MAG TPA: twin-arginine translocation signal domain-containing protein [Rhodobacteraceae bacterium]|nr:twin-arginine translocation signal domain-containing protein [Paracoccaceae bacterium]